MEEKLEAIERKVIKLIEQNAQYQRVCQNLLDQKKALEEENQSLLEQLKQAQLPKAEDQATLSEYTSSEADTPTESIEIAQLKTTIDQYIQHIDEQIEWLLKL